MKTIADNPILMGLLAGLVAALLMIGGQQASMLSIIMLTLAFAAVILAGLRAGFLAAIVAILSASASVALLYSSPVAFTNLLLTLAPAGLMSYLANFARPADEVGGPSRSLAWYPLADLMFYTSLAVALSTIVVVLANPLRDQIYGEAFNQIMLMMRQMVPDMPVEAEAETMIRSMIRLVWPLIQSAEMILVIFAGFYVAGRVVSGLGLGLRPREDIPTALRMHPAAIYPFGAGVIGMAFGGMLAEISACVAGAFAAGYVMAGYAVFHNTARDKSWKLPGLVLAYLLTVIFTLPVAFGFMIAGIVNPRRAMAITPNNTQSKD